MKRAVIIVVLLALVGIAASLLLIPGKSEHALMLYKDKHFEEAKAAYEEELKKGTLTHDLVTRLNALYLQYGQIGEAITVMEKYIAIDPSNIEARRELGTLYQYAQRPDDYLRNLEEINRIQSSSKNLETLSDMYNFNEQYDKQVPAVQAMVAKDKAPDPNYYTDLANMLASQKRYVEAIDALVKMRKAYPEKFGYKETEFLISLNLDAGKPEDAYNEAIIYRAKSTNAAEMGRLINILHFKGSPALARRVIEPYGDQIFKQPPLLAEHIMLLMAEGKEDEAYDLLIKLYSEKKLNVDLEEKLLYLAAGRNNAKLVGELAPRIDPASVPEMQGIALIELGQANPGSGLLPLLKDRFGDTVYMNAHPLLAAALTVALKDKESSDRLAALEGKPMDTYQLLALGRVCARADNTPCVDSMMGKLSPAAGLSAAEFAGVGELHLDAKRYEKGYAYVEEGRATHQSKAVETAWVKLAAATGKTEPVAKWLDEHQEESSPRLLTDLYFVSMDNKQYPVAITAAEKLHQQQPTSNTRSMLASAYTKTGQFGKALALLKENKNLSEDDQNNYLSALIHQASKDPAARTELAAYAREQLNGSMPEKRRMALLYALLDSGMGDIALPYVRALAETRPEWAAYYAERLMKQGKHAEARVFWLKLAAQISSPERKRGIAYALLEMGYANDATDIVTKLAEHASADSEDVKLLMFLWGPRAGGENLDWLAGRAMASQGIERERWLQHLVNHAAPEHLIVIAESKPELLDSPAFSEAYLEALYEAGKTEALAAQLNDFISNTDDPTQLRRLADFARSHGFKDAAFDGYLRVLAYTPENQDALQGAGLIAHSQANYSQSQSLLADYLIERRKTYTTPDPDSYLGYFYYAELLHRNKQDKEAIPYYQTAMRYAANDPSGEAASVIAQSMIRLGKVEEGLAKFRAMVDAHPDDYVLRADLVSTLLELERYDEARKVLAIPRALIPNITITEALPINGQYLRASTNYAEGRELLLHFNAPTTKVGNFSEAAMKRYPWLSYATEGQDSVLLVAKPGYRLEVSRDAKNSAAVSAKPMSDMAEQNLDDQIALRYELLSARVDLETGNHYAAAERLRALLKRYPNDPQLLGFTANAENFVGRWPHALDLLDEAHRLQPNNEDVMLLMRDIRRVRAPNIKLDHEWRMIGDNDEQITTLSGTTHIAPGFLLDIMAQNDFVDSDVVRRADGRIGKFSENAQRLEVGVTKIFDDGNTVTGSLFANNDTLGAGVSAAFINSLGTTGVGLDYHRPYWEFVEGVLDDANRDRVDISHQVILNPRTTLRGEVGVNRYNVKEANNVVSTGSVAFEAIYRLKSDPYVALGYGLDAEYQMNAKERTDSLGNPYKLLPFTAREAHFISLIGGYDINKDLRVDGLIGYGFDRLGDQGPTAQASLTWQVTDQVEAQIRAQHGLRASDASGDVTRLGAYILFRH